MDNFYKGCPAVMSDGRFLSDWRQSTVRNENIKNRNGIRRDDQYRNFLQTNGLRIMNNDWDFNRKNNSCWANECVHNYPTRTNTLGLIKQRRDYDSVSMPNRKRIFPCNNYKDYRASYAINQ